MSDKTDRAKGEVKVRVGEAIEDDELRGEGKLDKVGAAAKEKAERVKETADDAIDAAKEKVSELTSRRRERGRSS